MASETDSTIGLAVKELRTRMGLSQDELAAMATLGHKQTVSEIERGRRSLKATELVRIARVLHVEANDLLVGQIPPAGQFVAWREPTDGRERMDDEAMFLLRCRRYAFLERILGETVDVDLPQFPLDPARNRFEDMEDWAERARDILGLGDVPAAGLRETLENRWGLKLFRARLRAGSAATARGEFGNAIVEALDQAPARRSFSLAHELFHLLTWNAVDGGRDLDEQAAARNEQLANVFASALLMPEAVVRRAVTRRRPNPARFIDLVPVARSLSVSMPALLWRLVSLGEIQADAVRAAQGPAASWGTADPGWLAQATESPELPERYALLAFRSWVQGEISIGKLAELMETTVGMLEYALSIFGLSLDADEYTAEVLSA
jgi:Zn-dependent peptidase ImmA (M78 family)/DNA-binding XRE family transcriptional regulator